MESRRSAAARNDTARVKPSRSGAERSERAVGASGKLTFKVPAGMPATFSIREQNHMERAPGAE